MRAIDAIISSACPRLVGVTSYEDARKVLEPELLGELFLKPFAQATRIEAGCSLPDWFVATMKDSCDDFLDNGAKEFEQENAKVGPTRVRPRG